MQVELVMFGTVAHTIFYNQDDIFTLTLKGAICKI